MKNIYFILFILFFPCEYIAAKNIPEDYLFLRYIENKENKKDYIAEYFYVYYNATYQIVDAKGEFEFRKALLKRELEIDKKLKSEDFKNISNTVYIVSFLNSIDEYDFEEKKFPFRGERKTFNNMEFVMKELPSLRLCAQCKTASEIRIRLSADNIPYQINMDENTARKLIKQSSENPRREVQVNVYYKIKDGFTIIEQDKVVVNVEFLGFDVVAPWTTKYRWYSFRK